MANRAVIGLDAGRKLLLAAAGALAVAGPIAVGLMNAPPIRAQAQAAHVEFEVASVKAHKPGDSDFGLRFLPGGRFVSKAPLQLVISVAYNLPTSAASARRTGLPDWTRSVDSAYDIEATGVIPAGLSVKARGERTRLMLQALLADRFKLKIHRESKEMPVYALVVAKGGPKLQEADIEERDCPDPDLSATPPQDPNTFCHSVRGGPGGGLHARAADVSDLASEMENWTNRPLLDKTGIKGLYHIETTGWQPMQEAPFAPGARLNGVAIDDLPTIFEMFEKLGLKMESTKDKVDVCVIDHVEKPTEN